MGSLLATRQREQVMKARINPYLCLAGRGNGLERGVDAEAEIPARGPLHEAAHFEATLWEGLRMKPHAAYSRKANDVADGGLKRIREGNARELVPLPFKSWTLRQFSATALPGAMRIRQHALQRVTGNAKDFPMVGQQITEAFGRVVDAVSCIQLQLANGPIPDTREVPQPVGELALLCDGETELELPLDHATPISGIQLERSRVLWTHSGLIPYLKLRDCTVVTLIDNQNLWL